MERQEMKSEKRIKQLQKIDGSVVKVNRFHYVVEVDLDGVNFDGEILVLLTPKTSGDIAESGLDHNGYVYSHGGSTYKKACDKADEILQGLVESE
jgi:hypothetical protein